MARKHRSLSPFSLSFLDIMSCGLGAAALIFLLLKHNADAPTHVDHKHLLSEISLLEEEIKQGEEKLVRIRNTISDVSDETVTAQGLARKIEEQIKELKTILEEIGPNAKQQVVALKSKLARLEQQKQALEKTARSGNKAYEFAGDGERQYLTGLKLGGENVLILLDSSASMMDEKLVNIIRRRNMDDSIKLRSPKWQRAIAISEWIVANLPLSSDFQILTFNTKASPAYGNDIFQWYEVSDQAALNSVIRGVKKVVPKNGTNLEAVLKTAMDMNPKPDNIFLITDGLPTIKGSGTNKKIISAIDRLKLFNQAKDIILPGIPVNTLLLPLEGDPYAASAFWRLAIATRGSFLTPARDWP